MMTKTDVSSLQLPKLSFRLAPLGKQLYVELVDEEMPDGSVYVYYERADGSKCVVLIMSRAVWERLAR
jgi:hypothetical protein